MFLILKGDHVAQAGLQDLLLPPRAEITGVSYYTQFIWYGA